MKFYSAKEHFELRNSRSLNGRAGVGRFFRYEDHWGFTDGSGAVWPVLFDQSSEADSIVEGCVYSFTVFGRSSAQKTVSKYRDNETFLVVTRPQYEAGAESARWHLPLVDSPLNLPRFSGLENPFLGTAFIESATSQRLQILGQRSSAIRRARSFFCARGYLDLDPPQLVASGGVERYLTTFKTEYRDHRGQLWPMELPTSPEFSLKKIVAEGASRVFSLTHAFRNGGELSIHHDPEFMMLEWYRQDDNMSSLIEETQALILEISSAVQGKISLSQESWPVFTVSELFQSVLDMKLEALTDVNLFRERAKAKCLSVVETDTWDDVFCKLFMEFIEPYLATKTACFVTHYPEQMGALAAKSQSAAGFVDRFEAYVAGVEICNGYRELLDEKDFLDRKQSILAQRQDVSNDPQFESIMNVGLYPCVGNALGLDRLIAVLLGCKNIQTLLPWPFASRFRSSTIALE